MAGHRPAHEALILSRGAGSPQNPDHQVLSTGSSSPRIDNFIVQDIAADDE